MKLPKYSDKWRILSRTQIFLIGCLFGWLCAFVADRYTWHAPLNNGIFTLRYLQHLIIFLITSLSLEDRLEKHFLKREKTVCQHVGRKPPLTNAQMESYTFVQSMASVGQAAKIPRRDTSGRRPRNRGTNQPRAGEPEKSVEVCEINKKATPDLG
jgi:hypothetical protein